MGVVRLMMVWLGSVMVCAAAALGEAAPVLQTPGFSSSVWPVMRSAQVALPRQQNPHLLDDALYASIASYRTFDYLSTRRALGGGAREVMLPQWVVDNRGAFLTFEGLATATEVGGSIWLIRHRHRKMARAMNVVSIGLGLNAVIHNYQQPLGAPPLPAAP